MKLSIIIPTFNRSELLKNTLQSIYLQTFSQNDFEVLVIDNGSKDNTKEIVESFKTKIKNLSYFYESEPGLHVGRHKGLQKSKAEILVYADDDIEAFPTWLEGIWESFQTENVMLVGGKNLPKYGIEPPEFIKILWSKKNEYGNCVAYLSILNFGDDLLIINPSYVWGCNFSIKKQIILDAGGFHPDSVPENLLKYRGDGESYISRYIHKKGYITLYNPKASIYHVVTADRMKTDYFYKRAYRQAITDLYTKIRNQ